MSLVPGSELGSYQIHDRIGAGGMGEVYRATDTRLGREVAIKVLPSEVAADPDRLARFEREARTVASLNHPNIVTLHSIEDSDGVRFLTMELVEGKSLDHEVVSGGLPADRVITLGKAIASALAAAHSRGVVHRDLKPQNIMVTHHNLVKVLDFGLAKLEEPEVNDETIDAQTTPLPLSDPGQVVGTLPYMAPEQLRGEPAEARTDLFALGVVLYELATGKRPFEGATSGVLSSAILRDAPTSLSRLRADVPPDLDRVISRCLEKEVGARFRSAEDVGYELTNIGKGTSSRVGGRAAETDLFIPPPKPSTELLGREENLTEAIETLTNGARVLTISGYGGTGKTRFSIELFRRLAPDYGGGAAFISLASVTDSSEVLPYISASLDIAEAHGRSALEGLTAVLVDRPVLLVLDNLEQVIDAAGDLADLVAQCPNLQIIATSRAPLKIGAEVEFVLPPLALPQAAEDSPEALEACPSVALFVNRAAKVKPGFKLSQENASAIASICRRLDGLPLALELAAARVRILEPIKLLQRLDHALDLLTSGDRDLPLRQKTLRATISWSYSLLEAPEQQLLRRCSVFHEGWTFEAMEHVCYEEDERWRGLDELESLVEKGLVRVVGNGERYALLETIRAFSAEQLHAGGESEETQAKHAAWFTAFADERAEEFRGTLQTNAVRQLRDDNENIMAAIHWLSSRAKQDGDALENGLLLCGFMDWFWHVTGQHNTARHLLDNLLELTLDRPPSRGRALAYLAAGMVSITTGAIEQSLDEWTRGYQDGIALGDDVIASEGGMGMGYVHLSAGRLDEALPPLDDSISRASGGVNEFIEALSMTIKGMLLFQQGNLDDGIELVEDAQKIQRRINDCEGGGIALSFLAQMHFAKGDLTQARELYAESLATFTAVGDRPEIARVHCETGWTALADKDSSGAKKAFRRAVLAYEEVGSPRGTGLALLGLAAVEATEGRSDRAVAIAEAARSLTERAGVVCDHPMDPGVVERIEKLKVDLKPQDVDVILEEASELSPSEVLAMVGQQ
ncbi:MAG: protein kinase [Candidatus Eisenbacteria bacterium]|uniref:Protein kinase n=1 Tax=Eiseniibacteriota bacterium TaxID=2212470 RepID=A0A7Y2E6C8_UNCEI|nr:protein kinase [Candidatus Eisenbacteria bacterium]